MEQHSGQFKDVSFDKVANNALFRDEVLQARASSQLGEISLAQPLSTTVIATVAFLITVALILFILFGRVTGKTRVTGITVPSNGSLTVAATGSGVLMKAFVTEGQEVDGGQALFEISTERQSTDGEISALIAKQLVIQRETLQTERAHRAAELTERNQILDNTAANVASEQTQLEDEIKLVRLRHELAKRNIAKFETLEASGFVSDAQTQQKYDQLLELEVRLSVLNRSLIQIKSKLLSISAERKQLSRSLADELARLQRAEARLDQEEAENSLRSTLLILAPRSGTVATISQLPGQTVRAGQQLATILPRGRDADKLEVHLYAPSRSIGFVSPGQVTLIRYHAFPYQKFGLHRGTVVDISRTPFAPSELPHAMASTILSNAAVSLPGFNSQEALFRIKVRVAQQEILAEGTTYRLKPGMTVEADIQEDSRNIWEWIAAPLLALRH